MTVVQRLRQQRDERYIETLEDEVEALDRMVRAQEDAVEQAREQVYALEQKLRQLAARPFKRLPSTEFFRYLATNQRIQAIKVLRDATWNPDDSADIMALRHAKWMVDTLAAAWNPAEEYSPAAQYGGGPTVALPSA